MTRTINCPPPAHVKFFGGCGRGWIGSLGSASAKTSSQPRRTQGRCRCRGSHRARARRRRFWGALPLFAKLRFGQPQFLATISLPLNLPRFYRDVYNNSGASFCRQRSLSRNCVANYTGINYRFVVLCSSRPTVPDFVCLWLTFVRVMGPCGLNNRL